MNETTTQATPASRREGTLMGIKRNRKQWVVTAIAIAGLAGGAVTADATSFTSSVGLTAAPAVWPTITPTTCAGDPCEITLDVGTGTVTVADVINGPTDVPFLGFGVNGAPASLAGSPNSTIKVPVGTQLHITLTQSGGSDLIDLSFPSLPAGSVVDNLDGTYTVDANTVGTSVFQPGKNPGAPRQIASGLVGVLIVTPNGCATDTSLMCAYDGGHSYMEEALVAITDLDLEFACSADSVVVSLCANPLTTDFDMGYFGQSIDPDFSPRQVYHVINGKAFPDTDVIEVAAEDDVLLRYVNAGVSDKTMGLLGVRQTVLARNTSVYTDPQTFIAPLIGPGETADVAVFIPTGANDGQFYSLMDQGQQMNNGTATGFGGALTFLNVRNRPATPPPVPAAPTVDSATFAAPDQLTINGTSTSGNIIGAEVSIGATAAVAGSGTAVGSAFGAATYTETVTLVPAPAPADTVWVRVQDTNGWSDAYSVLIP